MIDECPDDDALAQLADGALGDEARAAIEAHLDGCAACAAACTELGRLLAPGPAVPPRYQVVGALGAGAMGVVWEAEDTLLGRRVALKLLAPQHADDAEHRARLLREARALAQLGHPNVVAVHELGDAAGEPFLALELVRGQTAREWLASAPRTYDERLAVWRQAARGLAAAHRAGVVHRDVKPDNVLVSSEGAGWRARLADFGLAQLPVAEATSLTATGAAVGTPLYMAPELLAGGEATAASDQFALCVALWEALRGARPFAGATVAALAVAMTKPLPLPRAPAAERRVLEVLRRGLDAAPARRWPSVDALLEALDRAPAARRRGRLALGAALLAGATALGWQLVARAPAESARADGAAQAAQAAQAPTAAAPAAQAPAPTVAPAGTITPGPGAAGPGAPSASAPARRATSQGTATAVRSSDTKPSAASRAPGAALDEIFADEPAPLARNWRAVYQAASTQLEAGRAADCVELLAPSLADLAALSEDDAPGVILLARCLARGSCQRGNDLLVRFTAARSWPRSRLAHAFDTIDTVDCAIDAPPQSRWVARAEAHLTLAAQEQRSCRPLLALMRRRGIRITPPTRANTLELICAVAAGECDDARARWADAARMGDVGAPGDTAEALAALFDRTHPSCAGR